MRHHIRSFLFAPASREDVCIKAMHAGADAVVLDLEDSVPPSLKTTARQTAAALLDQHPAWVRINEPMGPDAAADLDMLAHKTIGVRVPKVETPEAAEWVVARAAGVPVACAIESARGLYAAHEIASVTGVALLTLGGVDLRRDLRADPGSATFDHAKAQLVIASRAAGLAGPVDAVCVDLDRDQQLRHECAAARSAGYSGKSAIHPRQLAVIHLTFGPTESELAWARIVVSEFERSGGSPVRLPSGEFVDLPVAERARDILRYAPGLSDPDAGPHTQ
ncbi:HpcH/HpaI aldolase/citrate lyase family protein [Mycolicibacterium sp.]|uniref:HpcH/HpaI aldolase/citrate lyase family protein n=1 Tax=Mycolicibacterium sp. TaxID=2320850 RepID=UPI003D0CA2C3